MVVVKEEVMVYVGVVRELLVLVLLSVQEEVHRDRMQRIYLLLVVLLHCSVRSFLCTYCIVVEVPQHHLNSLKRMLVVVRCQ